MVAGELLVTVTATQREGDGLLAPGPSSAHGGGGGGGVWAGVTEGEEATGTRGDGDKSCL